MSTRNKEARLETIHAGSPLRYHSMNQDNTSFTYHGEMRLRLPRKVERARKKKLLRHVEQTEFSAEVFHEGVLKMRLGEATSEQAVYVREHLLRVDELDDVTTAVPTLIVDFSEKSSFPAVRALPLAS